MKFIDLKKEVDGSIDNNADSAGINNHQKNLQLILDIVNTINRTLVLDEVLELVLKSAINLTQTDRGFIFLINSDGELEFEIGLNSNNEFLDRKDFIISKSVINNVFQSGTSKFLESAQDNLNGKSSKSILVLELQTILCSPLITNSEKVGVIYVDSRKLHKIDIKEITNTFEIFAGQAATAIKNAQFYQAQLLSYKTLQSTNRELLLAKEEAEKSDRLKTEFLAQMSHEIRTPIHILLSFTNLIKEEVENKIDDELKSNFGAITEAGKRIIRTTDLILNMAEVQTGNYEYKYSNFSFMDEIILPIYSEFKIRASQKNLQMNLIDNTKETSISSDKYSIYQIFYHIIDNAVKFTAKGNIEIFIEEDQLNYIIRIKDTGIGISDEYLPFIFKPFSQEQQGYNRRYEGNGLGLALVKNYAEINSVQIDIETAKNVGTTFLVILPKA